MKKIVIIGGGVIGLGAAAALAQHGYSVTLCEANSETAEASWAAAGMLAPHNEASAANDLWAFGCHSLALWPQFLKDCEITPESVDYRENGSLIPYFSDDENTSVQQRASWLSRAGVAVQQWSAAELQKREPHISDQAQGALWVPAGQINTRLLARHLQRICTQRSVDMRFSCVVDQVQPDQITLASGERLPADDVIVAAGAWSPALAELLGLNLRGEPVKGQMLRFAAPADELLSHFVHCEHAYCVPRAGQGLVIGATMENAGFDRSESEHAIAQLATGARRVLPQLEHIPIAETWTGLRPKLADGGPLIDRCNNVIVATGHFRNGILLLPATVETIICSVTGDKPHGSSVPFCDRPALR